MILHGESSIIENAYILILTNNYKLKSLHFDDKVKLQLWPYRECGDYFMNHSIYYLRLLNIVVFFSLFINKLKFNNFLISIDFRIGLHKYVSGLYQFLIKTKPKYKKLISSVLLSEFIKIQTRSFFIFIVNSL